MFVYQHKVNYYETDRMGVTHHSNYFRFMEEARVAYMDSIGASYARVEADGVISPVIAIEGKFRQTTTFDDVIDISVCILELSRLKLKIGYTMTCGGREVFEGWSLHCFLENGKPVEIAKRYPQFAENFR